MKKSLLKTSLREIRSSFGRYIAILAIVALGVGFFAGLLVSESAMLKTGEAYLNGQHFYDFRLISTLGFDQDEIDALAKNDDVQAAQGAYQIDVLVSDDGEEAVVGRFHSITDDVNRLALKAGRLPKNTNECVAEAAYYDESDIGKTITITDDNTEDTLQTLSDHEMKIVGLVESPLYMRMGRYSSDIGSGAVGAIFFVSEDAFTSDYYSEVYIDAATTGALYSDEYNDSVAAIEPALETTAEDEVNARYDTITAKIEDGRTQAKEGIDQANAALAQAEKAGAGESTIAEITTRRDEAQETLDSLTLPDKPEIHVLTREDDVGYNFFKSDASIVSAVAKVFPIFFFLVAALVCVTTMTRMMSEQRTQIGVLKSMGYGNGSVLMKYLLYSGSAGLMGCLIGFFVGTWGFPSIIWSAYKFYYALPDNIMYVFDVKLFVISILVTLLCTMGVTVVCGYSLLKQTAATLIRPKAPKAGKRNVLERVTPLWRRLSFLQKITVRNLFRYKARFFMMILGIGGCTALIVTALGVQENFVGVADQQYNEIDLYDARVTFNHSLNDEEMSALRENESELLKGIVFSYSGSMDVSANGVTHSLSINAPYDDNLSDFFSWHRDDETFALPKQGEILLDKGIADRLGVEKGDKVTVRDSDMHEEILTVSGVYTNYISNNGYISRDTLADFDKHDVNTAYINFAGDDSHQAAADLMQDDDSITNVSISTDSMSMFADMLDSLNIIVYAIILCAGALAFIVLYNLTNINISERIREIATLKVLGFYVGEANAYVFRENTVLTVLGALIGLAMGKLLHTFVMAQIVVDGLTFDAFVSLRNLAISFVLTLLFAFFTQQIMKRKIAKIRMAESLKSVE